MMQQPSLNITMPAEPQSSTGCFSPLEKLSVDILFFLADELGSKRDIKALSQTNRRFHSILNPYLYRYDVKRDGNVAIWWAVVHKRKDVALRALTAGADIKESCPTKVPITTKRKGTSRRSFRLPKVTSLLFQAIFIHPDLPELKDGEGGLQRLELVRLLLDWGASLDDSSIITAATQGDDNVVRLLVKRGASLGFGEGCGPTLLHYAVRACNAETIDFLISKGLSLDDPTQDSKRTTPIHEGAKYGNVGAVSFLIAKGADVNACDGANLTPLNMAARHGPVSVVSLLIDNGADVNHVGNMAVTPLWSAIIRGDSKKDVMQVLIDRGANPNFKTASSGSLAFRATKDKNTAALEVLVANGASVRDAGPHGRTALLIAARQVKKPGIIRLLLENGANSNDRDRYGSTALHCVAAEGNTEGVVECLSKGLDVNARGNAGNTPLHSALNRKRVNPKVVQILLESNADVNASDNHENTPLHALLWSRWSTSDSRFWKSMGLLLKAGADVKATNNDGLAVLDNRLLMSSYTRATIRQMFGVQLPE